MANPIIDNRTKNLGMPLPNVRNWQSDDCERIIESFEILDDKYGETRLEMARIKENVGADLMPKLAEIDTKAGNAQDSADAAQGSADSAMTEATQAMTAARAAQAEAEDAKDVSVPRAGARGALAGYEEIGNASALGEPPTVTIESPDCVNLETSGAVTISFTPATADKRAVKALSLTATEATTLTISGAVWQNNGDAPEWGTAGKILVLLAHFVGGRVVLSVADNTE